MHNIIQELRGNIRVYVRVRPFLSSDKGVNLEGKLDPCVKVKQDGVGCEINRVEDGEVQESHKWEFDKSFPCPTTQDDIFLEVKEFVQSALDGYNVCLFSYGQTGSGKTHTMTGAVSGAERGIVPRAIAQVAVRKAQLEEAGWAFEMEVSFVEIYCEVIKDLLGPASASGSPSSAASVHSATSTSSSSPSPANDYAEATAAAKKKHKIVLNEFGQNVITGVEMVPVDPADTGSIDELMQHAASLR